jgi:D-aspartate ligase
LVNPPAVIIGGGSIAMPVVRSLGAAGVPVIGLGARIDPIRFSRFCNRFVDIGFGDESQGRALQWLTEDCTDGAVVVPCSDHGLELVGRNRDLLERHGVRPVEADDAVTLALLDKERTYAFGRALEIATPRTVRLAGAAELDRAADLIGFPSALKPVHSHRFKQHFDAKAIVVRDRGELEDVHRRAARHGLEVLLTEIVPGADDRLGAYFSYVDGSGRVLLEFVSRKVRQYPTGFGLACCAVTEWDPELAEAGLRFVQGVGVKGVAYTEFKRDARDGELKLIECNNRMTIEALSSPYDVPLLAYNRALGRALPPLRRRWRPRIWNPAEDVQTMLELRRRGELTFCDWARTLRPPLSFHVFRIDDPMPTIGHHWMLRRRIARKLGWRCSSRDLALFRLLLALRSNIVR